MSIDTAQFHQVFFEESFEGLDAMEAALLSLEAGDRDGELINTVFRAAHSIKGGGATFGFGTLAEFTHVLETLLDRIRNGQREATGETVNLLLESVDCLRVMLRAEQDGEPYEDARAQGLRRRLEVLAGLGGAGEEAAGEESGAAATQWQIDFRPHPPLFASGNDPLWIFRELAAFGELKVEADTEGLPPLPELDPEQCYLGWRLHLQAQAVSEAQLREAFAWVEDECELRIVPLGAESAQVTQVVRKLDEPGGVAGELVVERRKGARRLGAGGDAGSIRVGIEKVDAIINLVGELVITQAMLSALGEEFEMERLHQLQGGLSQLARNTRELQESVMRMRMLPISFVFSRFPRMIHDTAQKLDKSVRLEMTGEQTELDKTVIEKVTDPLVHLVRNSVDHGIEDREARRAAGKPETGTVHLNACHKGGNVVIEVSDDGRGIDFEKILYKARKLGLVETEFTPPPEQLSELLFLPGVSTADRVSDLSGRGVGMDVVRRNVQSLGGSIEVRSTPGSGSTFTVRLPLTLAILDGQLVAVGEEIYIISLVSIVESLQIDPGLINDVAGKGHTFRLRDEFLPIMRLDALFGATSGTTELGEGLLVVVEAEGHKVGLFVDELLGQQQVVIKSLETNYRRVEGVSGATILGDGRVALILDVPSLIRIGNR